MAQIEINEIKHETAGGRDRFGQFAASCLLLAGIENSLRVRRAPHRRVGH